jgi:hypothetical protein
VTKPEALAVVLSMATTVLSYGGNLESWASSPDAIDRWAAQALRDDMGKIAKGLAGSGASDADVAEVHAAMVGACAVGPWAAAEVAGRFRSAHRRCALVGRIRRHPRGHAFATLVHALERGRATEGQMMLANRLASEVTA